MSLFYNITKNLNQNINIIPKSIEDKYKKDIEKNLNNTRKNQDLLENQDNIQKNDIHDNDNNETLISKLNIIHKNRFCIIGLMNDDNDNDQDDNNNSQSSDQQPKSIESLILNNNKIIIFIKNIFYNNVLDYKYIVSLLQLATKNHEIEIYINSPGGSVICGYMLINYMKMCKAKITTIVTNIAASMGAMLWAHGDNLKIDDNAIIMFHSILVGFYDSIPYIKEQTDFINEINKKELLYVKEKNIITDEEYTDIIIHGKDIYLTGKEINIRLSNNNDKE